MLHMNPMYLFGEFICLIIISILIYHSKKQFKILADEKYFLEVMLTTILMILSDIFCSYVEGMQGQLFRAINIFCTGLCLFLIGMIGLMWLVYVDFKLYHRQDEAFLKRINVYSVPLILLGIILLFSQKYKLVYYIDEYNIYQRGAFYYVQIIIATIYVLYASFIAIKEGVKQKRRRKRIDRFSLATSAFAPLIGGVLQIFYDDLPLTTVGITIALLFICLNVQSKQVSLDTLTGINNRRQLNIYIESLISNRKSDKNFYMLIMDVNKFKEINDTYGHLEGDNALIKVAEALTSVCDKKGDFVARYGGDEFTIICKRDSDREVEELIKEIMIAIDLTNALSEKEYKLSLSIGYAQFFKDGDDQNSIMSIADKKLYEMKHSAK